MKAIPKKTTADIRKLLPRHLHGNNGGQGDQMFPDNTPGQHHSAIPAMSVAGAIDSDVDTMQPTMSFSPCALASRAS